MPRIGKLFLIFNAFAILGGCAERKTRAFPWATAVLVKPNPPAPRASGAEQAADIAPDFRIEPPASLAKVLTVRTIPTPPRSRSQNSISAGNGADSKSALLVPELSPEETAAAKAQFSEDVAIAERNLSSIRRRNLTANQQDAISKIKGFLAEAREAAGEGDWARARNLAKKAQILSGDLTGSL